MEAQISLYRTEVIKPRKPWHGLANVELATAEWVDWFNNQHLHTALGDVSPREHETNYYAQLQPQLALIWLADGQLSAASWPSPR